MKERFLFSLFIFMLELFPFILISKFIPFNSILWLVIILCAALGAWIVQRRLLGKYKDSELSRPSSSGSKKILIDLLHNSAAESLPFEFVLTDETTRKRIRSYMESASVRDPNLAYGVTDKDKTIFLSCCYSFPANPAFGNDTSFYEYVVLTDRSKFRASCSYDYDKSDLASVCVERGFEQYLDLVGQAIVCYENRSKRVAFEKQLKISDPAFDLFKLENQYIDEIRDSRKPAVR